MKQRMRKDQQGVKQEIDGTFLRFSLQQMADKCQQEETEDYFLRYCGLQRKCCGAEQVSNVDGSAERKV